MNYIVVALIAVFSLTGCKSKEVKTQKQKMSYMIGHQVASNMKRQNLELDRDTFFLAVNDVFDGKEPRMDEKAMREAMMEAQKEMMKKAQERRTKSTGDAKENVAKGKAYLDANKKKDGVKVTKSGLQYKVLKEGKGAKPTGKDKVQVHYKGTLIDGKEFDSSYKRGKPAEFPVMGVIKGWQEGLQLMSPGSKFQFVIPSELAYGAQGNPSIPGNSVLVFDVELIKIVK